MHSFSNILHVFNKRLIDGTLASYIFAFHFYQGVIAFRKMQLFCIYQPHRHSFIIFMFAIHVLVKIPTSVTRFVGLRFLQLLC